MRNLFDQYTQTENRLTHALVWALKSEPKLLLAFLKWLDIKNIPSPTKLTITEQRIPGTYATDDEDETKGLPDAMVYTEDGWAVIIESKVEASPTLNQLKRHRITADRSGFENAPVVLLTVEKPKWTPPDWVTVREWKAVYGWLRKQSRAMHSPWLTQLTQYIDVLETQAADEKIKLQGALTMFEGFHFSTERPYAYAEAKRQLRLFREELVKHPQIRALGVDTKSPGRSAITGKGQTAVWDFIRLKQSGQGAHTNAPHLTISVNRDILIAAITIPNGIKGGLKTRLKNGGMKEFTDLVREIEENLRPVTEGDGKAKPVLYATQRRFKSQRSVADIDGRLEVDIRTAVKTPKSRIKYQPEWVEAIYSVLVNKSSNIQFGIEIQFQYDDRRVQSTDIVDLFAASWAGAWPLVEFVRG